MPRTLWKPPLPYTLLLLHQLQDTPKRGECRNSEYCGYYEVFDYNG